MHLRFRNITGARLIKTELPSRKVSAESKLYKYGLGAKTSRTWDIGSFFLWSEVVSKISNSTNDMRGDQESTRL